jgi:hypothetical protein
MLSFIGGVVILILAARGLLAFIGDFSRRKN